MGEECERINFSASTTLDQLLGSIVPTCVNGNRVFAWRDGKLLKALRQGKWLLFDEINLATPEVLDGLAPLLYRDVKCIHIPELQEEIGLQKKICIFATMNPTTIGGGRFTSMLCF
jgi:midasin